MAYNKREKLLGNIEAIKTAFAVSETGHASEFDITKLMKYSGFGGMKFVLYPEGSKDAWGKSDLTYYDDTQELFKVLREHSQSPAEYREYVNSLKNSVLTSFYTPNAVVDAIAKALHDNGLKVQSFFISVR